VVVVCLQANISSPTSIGDANADNAYYPGGSFTSNDVGGTVRIIAGTGRYQTKTIVSIISGTEYGVDSQWHTQPDSTSLFIVEYPTFSYSSGVVNFSNQLSSNEQYFSVNIGNVPAQTMMTQVLINDPTGSFTSSASRSPFRVHYVFGKAGYFNIPIISGTAQVDLSNGPNQIVQLSTTAITILAPIFSPGSIVMGMTFTLYMLQNSTGTAPIPIFTGGSYGFASNTATQIQMDPTGNTRTSVVFTAHISPTTGNVCWSMDSQQTGVTLS